MTDLEKLATIQFFPSDEPGQISMTLDLPDDYDPENMRPFEVAALMVIKYMEEATDGFESIRAN